MLTLLALSVLQTNPRVEIRRGYDAWAAAYMRKDFEVLDHQIAPDFIQILPGGKHRDRVEFLGSIMRQFSVPNSGVKDFTIYLQKVEALGDKWFATITERASLSGGRHFGQVTRDGWQKTAMGWQIVSTEVVRRLDQ